MHPALHSIAGLERQSWRRTRGAAREHYAGTQGCEPATTLRWPFADDKLDCDAGAMVDRLSDENF
jgi:hypothetical protein